MTYTANFLINLTLNFPDSASVLQFWTEEKMDILNLQRSQNCIKETCAFSHATIPWRGIQSVSLFLLSYFKSMKHTLSATSIPMRSVIVVTIYCYISEHSFSISHLIIHLTIYQFLMTLLDSLETLKRLSTVSILNKQFFFPLVGLGLLIHTSIHTGLQGKNSLPCLHVKNASVSTVKWCYHEAWVTAHKVYWWRDSHF